MDEGQSSEIEVAAQHSDEHSSKCMDGKCINHYPKTIELPRFYQPYEKGKGGDGINISGKYDEQIQIKQANQSSAVHDGVPSPSKVIVPLPEGKSKNDYGNDHHIADGVGSVARKTSLYELVVIEGIEEIEALVVDEHDHAEAEELGLIVQEDRVVFDDLPKGEL